MIASSIHANLQFVRSVKVQVQKTDIDWVGHTDRLQVC